MAEILEDKDFNLNMTSHLIYAAVKKCPCGLDVYRENINDKGRTVYFSRNNNGWVEDIQKRLLTKYNITYLITPWNRVLLEKLTGSQLVKKFPTFMEPKGSSLHLQVPATCPYAEPDLSSPCPQSHFLKIHLNSILLSMSGSFKWSLSLRFPHQNPEYTSLLPHACYMPCPSHSSRYLVRHIYIYIYISLSSSLCSFLLSAVTSSLLGPNILPSTLLSNTLTLHSSLNVSDKVSQLYNTTGKIIAPYIVTSYFWIVNWKTTDYTPKW